MARFDAIISSIVCAAVGLAAGLLFGPRSISADSPTVSTAGDGAVGARRVAAGSVLPARHPPDLGGEAFILKSALTSVSRSEFQLYRVVAAWTEKATADEISGVLVELGEWKLPTDRHRVVAAVLLGRFAELKGEVAMALVTELDDGDEDMGRMLKNAVYEGWLALDPNAAVHYALRASQANSSESSVEELQNVLARLQKTNPALVGDFAARFSRSEIPALVQLGRTLRTDELKRIWENTRSQEAVLLWIQEESASPVEQQFFRKEFLELALRAEHMEIARPLIDALQGESASSAALHLAVNQFADKTPTDLFPILESIPEATERAVMWVNLVQSQTSAFRGVTLDYLLAQPATPERDQLMGQLANLLARESDHALAFKAISGIRNDSIQQVNHAYQIGLSWLAQDPTTARRFVPAYVIDAHEKFAQLKQSGVLEIIPGYTAELQYRSIPPGNP